MEAAKQKYFKTVFFMDSIYKIKKQNKASI